MAGAFDGVLRGVREKWRPAAVAPGQGGAFSVERAFILLAAVVSVTLFVAAYAALPGLSVFGHDEVHYYKDFSFKLKEDGRWLNYTLHHFLRGVPPGIWATLLLLSTWGLFFRWARSLTQDAAYSAVIASTLALAYPFVEQSLWPATTFPAIAVLLLLGWLAERGVSYVRIYLLGGVLLFGAMQSFYFLLPIFFLGAAAGRPMPLAQQLGFLGKHMVAWVLGSVLGVLVMSVIIYLYTGQFGVRPAAWRESMPAHNAAELVRNFLHVGAALGTQLREFFQHSAGRGAFLSLVVAVLMLGRIRHVFSQAHAVLILAAVFLSFFAFSVPLAPIIQSRSLVAMTTALLLVLVVWSPAERHLRWLSALALVLISWNYSQTAQAYLGRHVQRTEFVLEKLQGLIPGYPAEYKAVTVFGTMDGAAKEAEIFNSPPLMHPIVYAMGARDYWDCRQQIDPRCDALEAGAVVAAVPFAQGRLTFSVNQDRVGTIRFEP